MGKFRVELPGWEVDEGVEVALTVTGEYDYSPPRRLGHPDDWAPAWAELEVSSVTNARGCELPARMVGRLKDNGAFLRAVEEAIWSQRS